MTHEVGRLLEAVYIQVSMNTVLRIPLDDFILFLKIKSAWSFCIPLPPFWHQFCSCSQEGHLIVSFRLADFAFCFCFSRALYPRCLLAEMVQDLSAANPFILSVTQPLLWLNQTEQGNVTSCFSFFFCTRLFFLPTNPYAQLLCCCHQASDVLFLLALPEALTWQLTWQMHSIWLGFINHGKYSAIAVLPSAVLVS